jgi:FMN reductase
MKGKIKIIGIGGSLESKSVTLTILQFVMNEIKSLGSEIKIIDIKSLNLPLYSHPKGKSKLKPAVKKMLDEMHSSGGLVFASPEYHGTVSASFKNLIDYLELLKDFKPPYLTGKPIGCIAAAGSENSGAATLLSMISIVHSLRAIAAPTSIAIGSANEIADKKGYITNEKIKRKLKRLASDVYNLAVKLR